MMSRDAHAQGTVSEYREFPPPLQLRDHLLCLWTQSVTGSRTPFRHRVLPDGCIDIVLISGEPPRVVGARFRPGRATGLLGLPASELLNQSVPLYAIWSKTVHAGFAWIADEPILSAKRSKLESTLLRLSARSGSMDQPVTAAIHWLARHPSGQIEELSEWIGMSRRQLQRRFSAAVGYGPKMFQSVLRFQRVLHLASQTRHQQCLAHLSLEAGYADQAHMSREVRRFSGLPPTALLRSAECTLGMSDFFTTACGIDV
jgi:AraC-like DNA-binding protein